MLTIDKDRFDESRVLIGYNGVALGSVPWQFADELAMGFKRAASFGAAFYDSGVISSPVDLFFPGPPFELRPDPHDLTRTLMIVSGKASAAIPWTTCIQIASSFRVAARKGEEYAKANDIIRDQALLVRTGAPFAFSDDPRILDAARTEAQWGDTRTQMPMSIPSPRGVGTPEIFHSRDGLRRTPGPWRPKV